MTGMKKLLCFTAVAVMLSPLAGQAITYVGSGDNMEPQLPRYLATATFQQDGANLLVTLTNSSGYGAAGEPEVLTGLFFDLTGDPTLTRGSAVVPEGSKILKWYVYEYSWDEQVWDPHASRVGNQWVGGWVTVTHTATENREDVTSVGPGGLIVGGEWAYKPIPSSPPLPEEWPPFTNQALGISSAGLGWFGENDLFPGNNLNDPASPDGANYGILSTGTTSIKGIQSLKDKPLIKDSVVLTLGLPAGYEFEDSSISNVVFQYGTSLTAPFVWVPGVGGDDDDGGVIPEPVTMLGVLLGIGGVGAYIRRRRLA